MKKTLKRITALLLVCSVMWIMSACGNSAASTASAASAGTADASEAASEAAAPAEETTADEAPAEAPAEASAAEAEASAAEAAAPAAAQPTSYLELPLCEETQELSYWLNYGDDAFTIISSFDESRGYQVAEEKTNVHINFQAVSAEQQTEQFHIMVASGDWPDLIQNFGMLYTGGAVAGYTDGVIIDFADMAEECLPDYMSYINQFPDTAKAIVTDDGQMLSLYTLYMETITGPLNGMLIRQDWLDDLGLETPQTYDELHDVLAAFKSEKGASSPLFLIGSGCFENGALTSGYDTAVYINTEGDGVVYPFYQVDGQVKFGPMEEGFTEYVTMMNTWLNEGLINKDFGSVTGNPMDDQLLAAVTTGQTGYFNCPGMLIDIMESMIDDPNVDLEPMADVGKVAGQEFDIGWLPRNYNTAGASISTSCEDPELALKWSDYFYTEEGRRLTTYGVEGESYNMVDGEPQFTDEILNNPDNTPVTMMTKYSIGVDSLRDAYLSNPEFYSDKVNSSGDIWGTGRTGKGEIPINVSMTADETEEFNTYFSDISTYCQEMVAKFIAGDESLDNIPAFQDKLREMGIETCIELKQASLDRYNAR